MRFPFGARVVLIGVVVLLHGAFSFGQEEQDDLGLATAELLASRCSSCHGPDSAKPRAVRAWADATDFAATAGALDLVVPGDPDDSTLFLVAVDGEMPPSGSGVEPLSEAEVALIEDWIKAGAPLTRAASVDAVEQGGTDSRADRDETTVHERSWLEAPLLRWFGHFHPLLVHYPVALLSVALLIELLALALRKSELFTAASCCLVLGALAAIPTAALGWLLAESTTHKGATLGYHRWLGVSTATVALLSLYPFFARPKWRLPILIVIAALVGITGHMGGILSYGSDWLDWPSD